MQMAEWRQVLILMVRTDEMRRRALEGLLVASLSMTLVIAMHLLPGRNYLLGGRILAAQLLLTAVFDPPKRWR